MNKAEPCDGYTALHTAAQQGHVSVIELLVSKGAMVDARNKEWETPLVKAALKGHEEAAICLLDHGADVNAKDRLGFTPLLCAAQVGHLPVVELLVLRGAGLNLGNFQGVTPLITAAQKGRLTVVEFLILEKSVTVDQLAHDGGTALNQASLYGHLEAVNFLLSVGASVNKTNVWAVFLVWCCPTRSYQGCQAIGEEGG